MSTLSRITGPDTKEGLDTYDDLPDIVALRSILFSSPPPS